MRIKREIPGINSSSSADVAFLLLIFFLLISSLDVERGISRKLPPEESESARKEKMEIQRRNLLLIYLDENGQLFYNDQPVAYAELKDQAKEFIDNPTQKKDLPEKTPEYFEETGTLATAQRHMIVLQVDQNSLYADYIAVQNELLAAYRELRDSFAIRQFHQPYLSLTHRQQQIVRSVYPQKISEPEPTNKKEKQP